jgi:CRISPR/Cas system-associated endoribonuclease Cas2
VALLITYDLNNETRRPPIVEKIKAIGSWARLSESSYAVGTSLSPTQVHDRLKPLLDSDDHIYILTLSRPWTGYGPKDVNAWLEANL